MKTLDGPGDPGLDRDGSAEILARAERLALKRGLPEDGPDGTRRPDGRIMPRIESNLRAGASPAAALMAAIVLLFPEVGVNARTVLSAAPVMHLKGEDHELPRLIGQDVYSPAFFGGAKMSEPDAEGIADLARGVMDNAGGI